MLDIFDYIQDILTCKGVFFFFAMYLGLILRKPAVRLIINCLLLFSSYFLYTVSCSIYMKD